MKTQTDLAYFYRFLIDQPIKTTGFHTGERVIWLPQGYLDQQAAIIYDTFNGKALIWAEDERKIRRVPLSHLHKVV